MKNDKVIVAIGIVILLIAAAGVYFYKPAEEKPFIAAGEVLNVLGGVMRDVPNAIEVADSSPFYALIATPLAVHYDKEGNREVIPMYIKNMTNPSRAVIRTEQMVGRFIDLVIDGKKSPKEVSLELAEKYWGKSDLALIIKDDKEGYEVGLVATPIASYLSVPVIVTDKIDSSVIKTLSKLKVRYILICGNLSTDLFSSYKIETADDALNITISLVEEKFGEINYITMTNPLDAWRPKVLDKVFYSSPPKEIWSSSSTQPLRMGIGSLIQKTTTNFTFKIPEDYKYALVKVEVVNLDSEDTDELGDSISVYGGIKDPNEPEFYQSFELISYGLSSLATPAVRDITGKIVKDRAYREVLLYDRGGATYELHVSGTWLGRTSGRVQINVEVDKLENMYYAMMKGLSTVTPYLTAYHKGIIFARPDFAFYPDDNVRTQRGERCPGYYSVRKNPKLAYAHNMHVFEKIHKPLNKLLARLADIDISSPDGLKMLRDYYKDNPVYICVVGDAEMMPRIVYDNFLLPLTEDVDKVNPYLASYGLGTPSDFIYGNIDPICGDYSNFANDTYSYYPYQENIVGRLAGWDAQDVCAQVVRTIFYYSIIEKLGDWKNTAADLVGGGQDFQRPPLRYIISRITGNEEECVKLPTGYGKVCLEWMAEKVYKPMGFSNILKAYDYEAMLTGYSDEALRKIKKTTLLNRLLFNKNYVAKYLGDDTVKGREYMEKSNFIWANAHGSPYGFLMPGPSILGLGIGGRLMRLIGERVLALIGSGFIGPGISLTGVGEYSPRPVANMELGPSVLWIESCLCGKIGGMYPKNSISMAFIHAGVNALISSPMETNIGGGYLEPKKHRYDTPWSVARAYINTTRNMKRGIFPDPHFAYLIYQDMCKELLKNATIGLAFRNAKNAYLSKDANWTVWWSPPLVTTGNPLIDLQLRKSIQDRYMEMFSSKKSRVLANKYFCFQEYCLYGDPAFNPYVPGEAS